MAARKFQTLLRLGWALVCLLGESRVPKPGVLRRALGAPGVRVEQARVLGLRVLRVTLETYDGVGKRAVVRMVKRAAEAMRSAGCSELVFSRGFGYRDEVLREGFVEAGPGRLREALAAEVAKKVSAGGDCAAFFAERLSRQTLESLSEMCRLFRYVMADVGEDSRRAAVEMAARHGVSLLIRPSSRQLESASAAVFFDDGPRLNLKLPETCVAFFVRGAPGGVFCRRAVEGLDVGLSGALSGGLPPEFPPEALISAAMEAGTVGREDLVLYRVAVADLSRCTA